MSSTNTTSDLVFDYKFKFPDGNQKEFITTIDRTTMQTRKNPSSGDQFPEWAKLSNFKCSHCPLDELKNEYCPLALNLSDVLETFGDLPSFQEVEVSIITEGRTYQKCTSLQAGVSSLLGIKMVSSGCPVMGKLKSLLYFHLPFASLEETQIRSLSFYLLSQYVCWKKGNEPDWDMKKLIAIYDDIRKLNRNVSKQIAEIEKMDTSINSVIILNNFADYVSFTIDEKLLDELDFFLKSYDE